MALEKFVLKTLELLQEEREAEIQETRFEPIWERKATGITQGHHVCPQGCFCMSLPSYIPANVDLSTHLVLYHVYFHVSCLFCLFYKFRAIVHILTCKTGRFMTSYYIFSI